MLPSWTGAREVYRKAYALLERMGASGHATKRGRAVDISADMSAIIAALNCGDEERIKGLLLQRIDYSDSTILSI